MVYQFDNSYWYFSDVLIIIKIERKKESVIILADILLWKNIKHTNTRHDQNLFMIRGRGILRYIYILIYI